ncbi:hypothetical protein FA15DRAFT_667619 [Coprinopsis marcescibilis]|uniref:Uncharacterized protein n=1 Tax=Coprinopsis marcescibilis TaxID=230819 RepID=A0A5C3LD40_COPMA|nr:hypothetical protein FA15DRAFT_667619 [Coprinopsis marcescibilis]
MSRAVPYPFMVPIHSAAPPVLPCPVYTTSTKANTSFAAMWQQVSSELDYFLSSPDRGPSFIVHYSNMYATISNYITALPMSVSMLYAFIRRYLKAHVALLYEVGRGRALTHYCVKSTRSQAASGLEGLELLKFYALQFERYERASHLIHNIVSPHCKGLDREILFDTAFRDEDGSYTSLSLQLGGERACEDIFLVSPSSPNSILDPHSPLTILRRTLLLCT